jgi:PAS domain S-box-containing protein
MRFLGLRTAQGRARLATLLLLLILASVATVATSRALGERETHQSLKQRSDLVAILDDARAHTFLVAAQLAASIHAEDIAPLQDFYLQTAATIGEDMQAARASLIALGEIDDVAALDSINEQMSQLTQDADVTAFLAPGDIAARIELGQQYYLQIWPRVETMMADLNQLARLQQDKLADERTAADHASETSLGLLIAFSAFAFLTGAAALSLLVLSIVRPLASLQASARSITSGNLDARAEVTGPEEVASLARDFNDMTETLLQRTTGLQESEAKYRQLFEELNDAAFLADAETGIILDANKQAETLLGRTRDEIIGMHQSKLHPAEKAEDYRQRFAAHVEKGHAADYDGEAVRKDGSVVPAVISATTMTIDGRHFLLGLFHDISERKRAENALRESEAKYRQIFENMQDVFLRTDTKGVLTDISPSVEDWGYTREGLIGTQVLEVYEDPEEYAGLLKALLERGEIRHYEVRLKAADGRVIDASVNCQILYGPDGTPIGSEGTLRDVTERKRAEEERQEAQESTVMLLALAAETRDPFTENHLTRIQGYTEAIASELGLSPDETREIGLAALLHDLGKMRVPDSILTKPGPLSDEEWETMKQHPLWGEKMLPEQPQFDIARQITRHHHENWDGTGYPDGLRGEEIPLSAAIVAVADGFDAMISERPYKGARPPARAVEEIRAGKNQRYSPRVVEAFERALAKGEIKRITKAGAPKPSDVAKAA